MSIEAWLKENISLLEAAGIATARLDCLVLLEDETEKDRSWLLSHPEYALNQSHADRLSHKISERVVHTPLAYIRGKAEFYGHEFTVNKYTLVPRPETETMVELLQKLLATIPADIHLTLIDIGTGSGAIAITTKLENPSLYMIATDISKDCLEIARKNSIDLNADITLLLGDLLEPVLTQATINTPTVLLCNLPYVPSNYAINTAATHEPQLALYGGDDGLDLYRRLFKQTKGLKKSSYVLTESLPSQHKEVLRLAEAAGYSLIDSGDFMQVFGRDC